MLETRSCNATSRLIVVLRMQNLWFCVLPTTRLGAHRLCIRRTTNMMPRSKVR